jgi:hypothetical protein
MRWVFSDSGALSFTRLGHNRPHRTRPQPQTARQYRGSLTHLRDLARPGPRPSLCIHRTHHRSFSRTMGLVAQAHRWNILQFQQSAIDMSQSPPVLHWQLLRRAPLTALLQRPNRPFRRYPVQHVPCHQLRRYRRLHSAICATRPPRRLLRPIS